MVTMKDVAKAAGVSQASVSYAYSGSPRVSPPQREQIFAVAARLGYTGPNIAGRSLRSGRIGTVGVLVPGSLAAAVEDPSTALLLKGIVEVGELADVALTLLPVPRVDTAEAGPTQPTVLRGLVDGVVMHCLPDDHPVVEAVLARGIPAVAIDSPRLPRLPYVTVDHRSAGADQMKHVLGQGHRRIAIICDRLGPPAPSPAAPSPASRRELAQISPKSREFVSARESVGSRPPHPLRDVAPVAEVYLRERLAGYRDALREAGISDSDVMVVESADIDMGSGMAAVAELLEHTQPTAIVATSDVHAVAAVKVLRERGVSVPADVSVIGFDDAPIADLMQLTTIRQPLVDKGRTAARILLDLIDGQTRRRSVKPTELVVRASTGPPPGH